MARIIILALLGLSFHASARLKLESEKIKPIYLLANGQQVDAVEAVKASIAGQRVLKCQPVEATASDKGNISLKNVK